MKRKTTKLEKFVIAIALFIALLSIMSYVLQYPEKAWIAIYGGTGAFFLWCLVGYIKDHLTKEK